jgi:hypothetical protein
VSRPRFGPIISQREVYRVASRSIYFFILSGVRLNLLVLRPLLAYCTSPRWYVMVIVKILVEWRLTGETEVLGENLPQRHFVRQKSHMTRIAEVGSQRLTAWAIARPIRSIYLFICRSTALQFFCWTLAAFLVFSIFYTVGRTPWTRDQSFARPLPIHRITETRNKRTQTSVTSVRFEPTAPVLEWAKTVHGLDRTATLIGRLICSVFKILNSFKIQNLPAFL